MYNYYSWSEKWFECFTLKMRFAVQVNIQAETAHHIDTEVGYGETIGTFCIYCMTQYNLHTCERYEHVYVCLEVQGCQIKALNTCMRMSLCLYVANLPQYCAQVYQYWPNFIQPPVLRCNIFHTQVHFR